MVNHTYKPKMKCKAEKDTCNIPPDPKSSNEDSFDIAKVSTGVVTRLAS